MKLSIIIVSFNTRQLTLNALASVQAEIVAAASLKNQTEILVIDNNSTDGSLAALTELDQKKQITLLRNRDNRGFAAANNQGITRAKGELCFLLNSDTELQPGSLERLVSVFDEITTNDQTAYSAQHRKKIDRLGILAATLQNKDGTLQPQGGSFPGLLSLASHYLFLDDIPIIGRWLPSTQYTGRNSRQVQPVTPTTIEAGLLQQDWVGGAAMMIRQAVFSEVGLLDENIFMYGEDVEFCLRARSHHWDVAIDTQAVVTHLGSASSSSVRAIEGELKGYLYIWSKHGPLWQLPLVKLILKAGCVLRWLVFGTMAKQPEKAQAYARIWQQL